jgi:hypothetical protein
MVYGQMDNGTEQEFDPGDALILPPPDIIEEARDM